MSKFVPLQVPGTSLHMSDEYVGEQFEDLDERQGGKRTIKVIDFARDDDGKALHPANANADQTRYIVENVTHRDPKQVGKKHRIKQSTLADPDRYHKISH